jgi:hypothetical protein
MSELFPTHPEQFINPVIAAVVAQLVALWIGQYLREWRWKDLLGLAITFAILLAARLSIPPAAGGPLPLGEAGVRAGVTASDLFVVLWLSFVGASIATFGYETVMNLLGMANRGPRAQSSREVLGQFWR